MRLVCIPDPGGLQVYYVYGFMLLVFLILMVVTVCVTVVATYFLLNAENYRWQWTSFAAAASTSLCAPSWVLRKPPPSRTFCQLACRRPALHLQASSTGRRLAMDQFCACPLAERLHAAALHLSNLSNAGPIA